MYIAHVNVNVRPLPKHSQQLKQEQHRLMTDYGMYNTEKKKNWNSLLRYAANETQEKCHMLNILYITSAN